MIEFLPHFIALFFVVYLLILAAKPTAKKSVNLTLFLVWAFVFLFQVSANVFQKGLFMDGLIYSSIAMNMAENIGDFWHPVFLNNEGVFYSHPPLVFYLQHFFFKTFGDIFWVEKLYNILLGVLSVLVIAKIWKEVKKEETTFFSLKFLPSILLFTFPLAGWAIRSNVLEVTQCFFILLACCFFQKSLDLSFKKSLLFILLGAFFILLSMLCKGFTGLFPLFYFVLYSIVFYKKITIDSLLKTSFAVFVLGMQILLVWIMFNDSHAYFYTYIQKQVLDSVNGLYTTSSRFWIVISLFQQLLIPIIITAVLLFIAKKNKVQIKYRKEAVFYFCIGLSASLPLMISLKQSEFYLYPSLPFFAISFALLLANPVLFFLSKINQKKANGFFIGGIFVVVCYSFFVFKNAERDKLLIADLSTVFADNKKIKSVALSDEILKNYSLIGYAKRYHHVEFCSKYTASYLLKENQWLSETEKAAIISNSSKLCLVKNRLH